MIYPSNKKNLMVPPGSQEVFPVNICASLCIETSIKLSQTSNIPLHE